jgi:hypothetical protein
VALASVGVLALLLASHARADAWDQKTVFTFGEPVEIPGQVLSPGTYVFKLMNSMSDRSVVEVFNQNENHSYGMFLTIPDYRMQPTGKVVITFAERSAGAPPAVKAWFYPGENYGHAFVYSKARAAVAQVNHETVASTTPQTVAPSAPETAETTPSPAANTEAPPAMSQQQTPPTSENESAERTAPEATPAPAPEPLPKQLPQTASDLPFIALTGLLSLASAFLLRWVRAN